LTRWRSWDYLNAVELIDLRAEFSLLDEVLREVRSGQSRVLVLRRDPGVDKSELMNYLACQIWGVRRPAWSQICGARRPASRGRAAPG